MNNYLKDTIIEILKDKLMNLINTKDDDDDDDDDFNSQMKIQLMKRIIIVML